MAKVAEIDELRVALDAAMKAEAWMTVTVTRAKDGTHMFDLSCSNPITLHALIAYANAYADEWLNGTNDEDEE